jgi:hypothetical protein
MLRLDSAKNGEVFWVLSQIRKTVRKFYFRKKFYVWQITAAFFESITAMTQEKLSALGKLVNIYSKAELLFFFMRNEKLSEAVLSVV